MPLLNRVVGGVILTLMAATAHADELQDAASYSVKSSFATATLLSDNDVVQLGIMDFNPNKVIGTDNDSLGSDDATALRDSIKQYNFPWNYKLDKEKARLSRHVGARISLLDIEQDLFLGQTIEDRSDRLTERVTSVSVGGGVDYQYTSRWRFSANLNLAWMRYRNRLDYVTDLAPEVQAILNGLIVNYDVDMVMFEPSAEAAYAWTSSDIDYELATSFHYLYGIPTSTDAPAHDVHPSEWYITTSAKALQPIQWFNIPDQHLKYRVSRVQLSDILSTQMGASSFYEFEFGWIKKRPDDSYYVREYGIGVDFNFNSVLKGGTLILYLNF